MHGAVLYISMENFEKIADQTKAYELAGNEAVVKPWIFYEAGVKLWWNMDLIHILHYII